ncbi:diamine N-acetyltransferase [Dysgonomonas sp. PH5-45]|uniref:GNAT family N-acetyltransferase n=1 Tax=unclassified Dysgonomonas TaxID=2630389 RepID=UPI002474E931|nr:MULTISPECIES: GNAT family N-acetyltransferase [unclassified Dysgonomonas]MDH6354770.1 diamine N-acetyltransferase [Dysgonomonas sp. PH5-45]MDH6387669.1 diamine N-acetyltransferase [Dysgonomonas sp. PH5-37]
MLLEKEHIKLRAVEPEDLDVLYKWENDTRLWIHGTTLSPYSRMAIRQYIEDSLQNDVFQNKQLRLMVELRDGNKTIGTVDLYEIDPLNSRAGIGILIDDAYRGKNYGSEVLSMMSGYAFHHLHLRQLYAHIASDNESSIRLFRKEGYTQSGVLEQWIHSPDAGFRDVLVFQLIQHA